MPEKSTPSATPGRLERKRQGLIRGIRITDHCRVFSGEKRHPQPNFFLIVFNDSLQQAQEFFTSWRIFLPSKILPARPHHLNIKHEHSSFSVKSFARVIVPVPLSLPQ